MKLTFALLSIGLHLSLIGYGHCNEVPSISSTGRNQIRFMRSEWKTYKKLICTNEDLSSEQLAKVDACYRISIFDENNGHEEQAFETCRKTIFGGRKTRNEIRLLLCSNDELMRWYGKCISDIRFKKYGDVLKKYGSVEALLEQIWPMFMERQICLKEALGVKLEQTNNHMDESGHKAENV